MSFMALGLFGEEPKKTPLRPKAVPVPEEPKGVRLRAKRVTMAEVFTEMGLVPVEEGSPIWVNPREPSPWVWVPGKGWAHLSGEVTIRRKS